MNMWILQMARESGCGARLRSTATGGGMRTPTGGGMTTTTGCGGVCPRVNTMIGGFLRSGSLSATCTGIVHEGSH